MVHYGILKNEKYVGRWMWNRTETRRDPRTGRKRRVPKPESEWHIVETEDLRVVSQGVWDRVVARWNEVDRVWPIPRHKQGPGATQRSYVETNPTHLLSGLLRCGVCGHAAAQVSGKSGGYYGCLGATKKACDNKLLVRRRVAERQILAAVRDRINDSASLRYVLQRVENEVRRLNGHLPGDIKLKRAAKLRERRKSLPSQG